MGTARAVADVKPGVVISEKSSQGGTPPVETYNMVEMSREIERLKTTVSTVQRTLSAISSSRYRGMVSDMEDERFDLLGDGDVGDIIDLMLMDDHVIWRFVFEPEMDETHPWHFVGGGPVVREEATSSQAFSNTSYVSVSGAGTQPSYPVPATGYYVVDHWSSMSSSAAGEQVRTSVKNGAAAASDSDCASHATGRIVTLSKTVVFPAPTDYGESLNMVHRMSSGSGTVAPGTRGISVTPVMIGSA